MRLQRWGLGLGFRIENQSRTCTLLPLKGMATILKIASTKAFIHDKLVHSCIINHFHSLLMRACNYCLKWNSNVNTDKTQIVKFRKVGIVNEDYKWYCEGN